MSDCDTRRKHCLFVPVEGENESASRPRRCCVHHVYPHVGHGEQRMALYEVFIALFLAPSSATYPCVLHALRRVGPGVQLFPTAVAPSHTPYDMITQNFYQLMFSHTTPYLSTDPNTAGTKLWPRHLLVVHSDCSWRQSTRTSTVMTHFI